MLPNLYQSFSHTYFCAICLALKYRGQKDKTICLHDSKILCLKSIPELPFNISTFLHSYYVNDTQCRTILQTIYPKFNLYLKDNPLLDVLKVQLQIVGVDQDPNAIGATFHYQMA